MKRYGKNAIVLIGVLSLCLLLSSCLSLDGSFNGLMNNESRNDGSRNNESRNNESRNDESRNDELDKNNQLDKEEELVSTNDFNRENINGDNESEKIELSLKRMEPVGTTSVKICAVGDIMVHMNQLKAAKKSDGSYDFKEVFEDIRPYIEEADIAIGNLETTISTDEIGYTAYPMFKSPESLIPAIKGAGFDVLTTANNHSLDGVEFGVENTLDKLDEYGILHTGTARSPEERDEILMIEKNDIKIAILSYTYGTNGMEGSVDKDKLSYMVNYLDDIDRIEGDINRAKEEGAEFIIACAHWGEEYVRNPNESQKQMADKLFSMGVDVILGSHAHVIQPTEKKTVETSDGLKKDVFVIYSLGNIVSNQRDRYRDSGLILNLEVIKDHDKCTIGLGEIDYIPTWVYRFTENDGLHYRVLPVKDFMDDSFSASSDDARIKEVWNETTSHLDNDDIKARD